MNAFLTAWLKTGREEGGYSDNPADAGGETMFGITERVARAHGYKGEMRDLPQDRARGIAKSSYWDLLRLDQIAALSARIAEELFDTGINCGQATAAKFLQRSLNALNREGTSYSDVLVDGLVGQMSIAALQSFLNARGRDGELVMLRALNALQGAYYIQISESRPANETFVYGWLLNRVAI